MLVHVSQKEKKMNPCFLPLQLFGILVEHVYELCLCVYFGAFSGGFINEFISIWLFMIVLFGFIGMHIWIQNYIYMVLLLLDSSKNMLYESYSSWHINKLPPRTTHIYVLFIPIVPIVSNRTFYLLCCLLRMNSVVCFVSVDILSVYHNYSLVKESRMVRLLKIVSKARFSWDHRSWFVSTNKHLSHTKLKTKQYNRNNNHNNNNKIKPNYDSIELCHLFEWCIFKHSIAFDGAIFRCNDSLFTSLPSFAHLFSHSIERRKKF